MTLLEEGINQRAPARFFAPCLIRIWPISAARAMLLIGFSGGDAMILLSLGPELVQIFRYPFKSLLQRLLLVGGNVAPKQTMKPIRGASQFGQQIVKLLREDELPRSPIRLSSKPFHQPACAKTCNRLADGRRFQFQFLGDFSLRKGRIAKKLSDDPPLCLIETDPGDPRIVHSARAATDLVHKIENAVIIGDDLLPTLRP